MVITVRTIFSHLNNVIVAGDTGQLGIGMNIYNRIQSTNKGSYVPLDRRTNHPLTRETKYICEETTALLLPYQVYIYFFLYLLTFQILSGFDYGGVRVDFEKEELTKIKVLYKPGLTLLGNNFFANYNSLNLRLQINVLLEILL